MNIHLKHLLDKHGFKYVKKIDANIIKVYDQILEEYAIIYWELDKYNKVNIIQYMVVTND